jgi:hypothetical protein
MSTSISEHVARIKLSYQDSPPKFILRAIYFTALLYILIAWRAIWTPDLLFVMFLLLFMLYGKGKQFLISFGPFALLLLTYDAFRGLAPFLNGHVHYWEMIDFDRWIGGGVIPTERLQHLWYHGGVQWYDYYFYLIYMCHFLTPWLIAIAIWKWRPQHYNRYVVAFLLLSYAGFLTYLLFPAAPPWMAAEMHLIPPMHKISTDVWWSLGVHNYSEIYSKFSPNLVAAVPSLHAAYPTLMLLFVWRAFGWRWGAAFSWYPISIWVGIVYMGEHYLIDALLGILYACAAYVITNLIFKRYGARARARLAVIKARYHATRRRRSAGATQSPK